MMAESLDDGEFWLPPQFLADDDNMLDHKSCNTRKSSDRNCLSQFGRASFPLEFGTFGGFSDFSSPGESLKGSSETESDEEDYMAGLTLRMAHSSVDDAFDPDNAKGRVVSGSPQSTLCGMGSGSGCSQGSSRGSPKGNCKVSSPPATWDLLHAAAGEVARMRTNDCAHGVHHHNRGTPQVSVPVNNSNAGTGFYQQLHAMQFQQEIMQRQNLAAGEQMNSHAGYQQQQIHQMVHNGVRGGEFVGNRDHRSRGLSSSAWLPPQQPPQGSGMRALFLGTPPAGKRECAGTGVFLPRHTGTQSEPRKKPGCSTVLVPARVMQALNLNLDDICSQPHLQPVAAGRFNAENGYTLGWAANKMSDNKPIGHSSNHIFASLLQRSEVDGKREEIPWHPKTESNSKSKETKSQNTSSREASSFNQEQIAHPCHLSSSIYYGGQDVYPHPHNTQNPATGLNSSIKKDGEEDDDDSGGASRGNWWKGSLYY